MESCLTSTIRRDYALELPDHHEGAAASADDRRRASVLTEGRDNKERWPLLIALHGYQGDKDSMMRVAHRISNGKLVVISLQGPNQFFINYGTNDLTDPKTYRVGFGWGTSYKMDESVRLHHQNIRALIDLAVRKYHVERREVFLLAFSQACAYNYRFVFTYPRTIRGAIGVCGGTPGDWDDNPRYRKAATHVLHIAATQDVWYSREKNLEFRRQLAQRAASLDFRFYHSPHKFPRTAIPHIRKWIESRFKVEG